MPIFEYECRQCHHRFEAIVQGRKRPACPSCGERNLEKQLSAFAVGTSNGRKGASASPGACGTCGDPRGPGSCSLD
jgi:putative FmdB family regulatory protein